MHLTKEGNMILVRDVFRLKFGKAKEAKESWKEGRRLLQKSGAGSIRVLVDLVGPYYTLVAESTYENLTAYERSMSQSMGGKEAEKWYRKFVPLVEKGYREIFTVVDGD
jgi:hypothetical protein